MSEYECGDGARTIADHPSIRVRLVNGDIIRVSLLHLIEATSESSPIWFYDKPRNGLKFTYSKDPNYHPSTWIEPGHIAEILD